MDRHLHPWSPRVEAVTHAADAAQRVRQAQTRTLIARTAHDRAGSSLDLAAAPTVFLQRSGKKLRILKVPTFEFGE
jgi:hypothetical protein